MLRLFLAGLRLARIRGQFRFHKRRSRIGGCLCARRTRGGRGVVASGMSTAKKKAVRNAFSKWCGKKIKSA